MFFQFNYNAGKQFPAFSFYAGTAGAGGSVRYPSYPFERV